MVSFTSKHCGRIDQPWTIISNANILNVRFRSDSSVTDNGFLAIWSATNEPPTFSSSTGCDNCVFPFVFGNITFDTCISVQGVDDQPWCSGQSEFASETVNEGTHVIPSNKISCSDSDSSCPSSPPQQLITSPNYPQYYPNNIDEVKLI